MMLSLACVIVESFGLPPVGLSKDWNDGDGWIPSGVMGRHAQIC
jgi:hypothetical protein